jgi:hypothetical protein
MTGGARRTLLRWSVVLLLAMTALSALPAAPATAQADLRYFGETGHWLRGAFRQFWERNGAVERFGFPVTEEFRRGDGRLVQYFQRARFELRADNSVELGQLGRDATGDRVFPQVPPFPTTDRNRYFPETGHSLKGLFRQYWETRGGEPFFGFPISEEISENIGGQWLLVQYFTRARFELKLYPSRVEIGLLGDVLAPAQLRDPWPPNIAPPGPLNEDGTPRPPPFRPGALANVRVVAERDERARTDFRVEGEGYRPGERVRFLLIAPSQKQTQLEQQPLADVNGSISYAGVRFSIRDREPGVYYFSAQGQTSGRAGIAVIGEPVAPPGPGPGPAPGALFVSTNPPALASGQQFFVEGGGFQRGEKVALWLTAPDQSVRGIDDRPEADTNGFITNARVRVTIDNSFRPGGWFITAQGQTSKRTAIGQFQVGQAGPSQPPPVTGGGTPNPNPENMRILIHDVLRPVGDASVVPLAAAPGGTFAFTGGGFDPNERVSVWFTRPGNVVVAVPDSQVQRSGATVRVAFRGGDALGDWAITAQGARTGRAVVGRFKVTRDYVAPLGTRRPANRNGSVSPAEGGQRAEFRIQGQGFRANEPLEFWITSPDGLYVLQSNVQADGNGRIGRNPGLAVRLGPQNPTGVYGYHYRGTRSGVRAEIYFTYTGAP